MKVLLDTHVFLWLQTEPKRLGHTSRLVEDPRNERLLSAASSWEIAIKYRLGRLPLPEPPQRYVRAGCERSARGPCDRAPHALAVAELEPLHKDPFDRLLVAQAAALDVPILTADGRSRSTRSTRCSSAPASTRRR